MWLAIGIVIGIVVGIPLAILALNAAFKAGMINFLPW